MTPEQFDSLASNVRWISWGVFFLVGGNLYNVFWGRWGEPTMNELQVGWLLEKLDVLINRMD